jgi:parallel beta-helix repeat protein
LTTVKKISQRGLVTAAIMLPLMLGFYSLADAATPIVNIACGKDIDATINNTNLYPRSTPQRFVLGADCTFTASATIVPSNGDEVACAVAPTFVQRGPAFDPTTRCTVAGNSSVENVFRPIGQGGTTATVRFEGIKITGGNYTGSTGSGAAIAEGSMTNLSTHYGIEVRDNDAAGILSAKGTFERVEFTNNTLVSNALGVIGAGLKARNEVEVKNSYVHDTQGNGLWCDNFCEDSPTATHPNGFWVHHNLVVNNRRAGIRFERVGDVSTAGEALIEYNEVHGNSIDENRGGISVRDAQNATIRNNRFGDPPNARNVATIASDSGRSDRPNLFNIDIVNNTLNGEIIKGCELPDTVVDCTP